MTVLVLPAYADFRDETLSGVTGLLFTADGFSNAFFKSEQIGTALAADLNVTGGPGTAIITIAGGSMDLSAWTFENWKHRSYITVFDGAGADVVIGSAVRDILNTGEGDVAEGRGGNDQFVVMGGGTIRGGDGNDDVFLAVSGSGGTVDGGAGKDTLHVSVFESVEDLVIDFRDGGSRFDLVDGWQVSDMEALDIVTGDGNDLIVGANGDDVFDAGDGRDAIDGRGGNDRIGGGNQKDLIRGGMGQDVLLGGRNDDLFIYIRPDEGGDQIRDFDFHGGGDRIGLFGTGFGLFADALAEAQLQAGQGSAALTEDVRFIYDTDSGRLFFDADGNGDTEAVLLARLPAALGLDTSDFVIL